MFTAMLEIVAVRLYRDGLYTVPAEVLDDRGDEVLVRFAAGNIRFIESDQISKATAADREEYLQALR